MPSEDRPLILHSDADKRNGLNHRAGPSLSGPGRAPMAGPEDTPGSRPRTQKSSSPMTPIDFLSKLVFRTKENDARLPKVKSTVWDPYGTMWSSMDYIYAARDGLLEVVEAHMEVSSTNIHDMDEDGYTALHHAARYNRSKVMEVLLEYGADPDIKGGVDEMRPLHMACRYNSEGVVGLLLAKGAQINMKDLKGRTALHYATRRGHHTATKMLLSSVICDVNAADNDLTTPLIMAAMQGDVAICELLISRGADIQKKDVNDMTALMWVSSEGHRQTAEIILKAAQKCKPSPEYYVRAVDNEGNTALHLAVQNGCYEVCELLLQHSAEVNCRKRNLATPLHVAATCGFVDIGELLINHGADADSKDMDLLTPIHRAALYNKVDMIDLLTSHGGNLNAKDKKNMQPLHCGSWKGQTDAVEYLLDNGAQIAESDSSLKTALHWAVQFSHYETLMVLLKHGGKALLECGDKNDQTVLHYAAFIGNVSVLKTILEAGARPDPKDQEERTPLHLAAQYDNMACVEALIQASSHETNDDDVDGRTPLLLASNCGNNHCVQVLLSLGADVSKRDDDHCTALMLAAAKGHSIVMKTLLDNQASVNDVDKMKNSALHYACSGGHAEAVQILLAKRARVTLKNARDQTCLDLAVDNKHSEAAQAMLQHKSWREAMNIRDVNGQTVLDRLIAKLPEVAMVVLDHCVERTSRDDSDPTLMLAFDYQYIDPGPDDPASSKNRYLALISMIVHERINLLSHPLCQNLLSQKWVRFGRSTFYMNLFIYTGYLASLTTYVATLDNNFKDYSSEGVRYETNDYGCPFNVTGLSDTETEQMMIDKNQDKYPKFDDNSGHHSKVFEGVLIFFLALYSLREILKLFIQRVRYFLNGFHYIGWILVFVTSYFVFPIFTTPCSYRWRAGWISLFLAWINFIMYLRRIDSVGIYVIMFVTVMISMLKAVLVFVLFVFAFAGSFYIIMANDSPNFNSIWKAGMTVTVMSLGEIELADTFLQAGQIINEFKDDTYILLLVFLFIMPIVLMNLLIGIAVGDIEKVQQKSYLKRIALQVDLLYNIENCMPEFLQRKVHIKRASVKPNDAKNTWWLKLKRFLFGSARNVQFIEDKQVDRSHDLLLQLQEELHNSQHRMRTVQSTVQEHTNLLQQILSRLEGTAAPPGGPQVDTASCAGSATGSTHETLSVYDNISVSRLGRTRSLRPPVDPVVAPERPKTLFI